MEAGLEGVVNDQLPPGDEIRDLDVDSDNDACVPGEEAAEEEQQAAAAAKPEMSDNEAQLAAGPIHDCRPQVYKVDDSRTTTSALAWTAYWGQEAGKKAALLVLGAKQGARESQPSREQQLWYKD